MQGFLLAFSLNEVSKKKISQHGNVFTRSNLAWMSDLLQLFWSHLFGFIFIYFWSFHLKAFLMKISFLCNWLSFAYQELLQPNPNNLSKKNDLWSKYQKHFFSECGRKWIRAVNASDDSKKYLWLQYTPFRH